MGTVRAWQPGCSRVRLSCIHTGDQAGVAPQQGAEPRRLGLSLQTRQVQRVVDCERWHWLRTEIHDSDTADNLINQALVVGVAANDRHI